VASGQNSTHKPRKIQPVQTMRLAAGNRRKSEMASGQNTSSSGTVSVGLAPTPHTPLDTTITSALRWPIRPCEKENRCQIHHSFVRFGLGRRRGGGPCHRSVVLSHECENKTCSRGCPNCGATKQNVTHEKMVHDFDSTTQSTMLKPKQ